MGQFFNAHAHSHGSLLDGMSRPEEYAERALALGQPAITFTDHGTLYSLMDTYKAAKKIGIPYMPGIEAYRARKTRLDTDAEELSGPAINEWGQRGPYHQTILAYNNIGYVNLMKLSSASYLEGFLRKPRLDLELMSQYSEGIVVLSGCLSGALQQALLREDFEAALAEATTMQDIVGRDNYFIEIMDHGIPEEKQVHKGLMEIARRIDAPIVPTCDSHYTHQHDADHHDSLLCINTKSFKTQVERFKFSGDEFYLKSYDEMVQLFPEEWVANSLLIPDKLEIDIDLDTHHYPVFEIPEESPIQVVSDYFLSDINKGAVRRFGEDWKESRRDVADRLNYEVGVIRDMGYESYFLIVADIIEWCRQNDILVGPGRGSSASSMVSYCLGITHIDPLEFDLLFERFLTPGRVPDIDIDVDDRHRDKVLQHIRDKYGEDRTAQIFTVSQMRAKSCINSVARIFGHPFDFSQKIVKAMPPAQYGVPKTLSECMEADEFLELYEKDEDIRRVVDTSFKLEDLWQSDGIHAGGIIVADDVITNYCPIQRKGEGNPIVTQWDMRTVEDVGLLKIDLLGLRNLGIIQDTIERIQEQLGIEIGDPYELVNNPSEEVFAYLSKGNTAQVFQMGSDGITNLVKAMGIESVKDIMAALALYRPGPMGSGFHHAYAKRKRGQQSPTPLHPLLDEVLAPTYGILLYQEQVMAVAKEIAGFDPTAANKFLKSIGKKDREAMAATKQAFVEGCVATSKIPAAEAEELFAAIEPHADYSFSAAHAAVYAYISYITAHLKYYYPAQYSAACLTSVMFEDSLKATLNDVQNKIGVNVNPPSVNTSQFNFVAHDDEVVFSISGLKGIGDKKSRPFVEHRDKTGLQYESVHSLLRDGWVEVIDKTFLESLIYSGALDDLVDDGWQDINVGVEEQLDILNKESEYIGSSVTGDPFEIYFNSVNLGDNTKRLSEMSSENSRGKFCAVITGVEIKTSKAGRKYARLVLEDSEATVQALLLGQTVDKVEQEMGGPLEDYLTPGNLAVFYGRFEERDEEDPAIYLSIITDIHTPRSVGDLINSVSIYIENQKEIGIINKILSENPGSKKVYVHIKHPDAKMYIKTLSEYQIQDEAIPALHQYMRGY